MCLLADLRNRVAERKQSVLRPKDLAVLMKGLAV